MKIMMHLAKVSTKDCLSQLSMKPFFKKSSFFFFKPIKFLYFPPQKGPERVLNAKAFKSLGSFFGSKHVTIALKTALFVRLKTIRA